MRRLIGMLLLGTCCFARQDVNKNVIMQSGLYYYGVAVSSTFEEARDHAVSELTRQIAVQVSSSFERVIEERGEHLQDKVESIIKTHAIATLHGVQTLSRQAPGDRCEVFCYLLKSEVEKVFSERKRLIAEIVKKADLLSGELNLAHALKYYYFAAILANSLPDQNVVYESVNYSTEIPLRINNILEGIEIHFERARAVSELEREVTLQLFYRDKPAAMLDLIYWDGSGPQTVNGRDGLATFSLFGASTHFDALKVQPKYAYYEARKEIQTVNMLWQLVIKPEFNRFFNIPLMPGNEKNRTDRITIEEDAPHSSLSVKTLITSAPTGEYNVRLNFEEDIPAAPVILREVGTLLKTIAKSDPSAARRTYQYDTFLAEKVSSYLKHNHPQPLDQDVEATLNKTTLGWELRRIRMLHRYPTLRKQSTEYLVLDFTSEGKLCDLNTSITENLYKHFIHASNYGSDWNNRQEIIKFLEKYRTAYLTRDLPTVDLMFAEEAIIIVGRKLEKRKLADQAVRYEKMRAQPDYEYLRLTKDEYLRRQKEIFAANHDISLDFSTFNIVKKNDRDSVYGVEMRQSYASTTYADEGYLFLLIDFRGQDPLIFIRAWQPNAWNPDELIQTGNFKIYK